MGNEQHTFSQSKLEGALEDVPFDQILSVCRKHMVTGRVILTAGSQAGEFELRAGIVDAAQLGRASGGEAVDRARELTRGTYTLIQGLPSLDGEILGSRAEASLGEVSLSEIMRHCEDNALSCTITVESKNKVGEIIYKVGEISDVRWAGQSNEERIVDIVNTKSGTVRVSALPLDLAIEGWPSASDEEPFSLTERGRIARGSRPAPVRMSGGGSVRLSLEAASDFLTTPKIPARPAQRSIEGEFVARPAAGSAATEAGSGETDVIELARSRLQARRRADTTAVIRKPRAATAEADGPSWMIFALGIGAAFALGALVIWFASA